MRWVCYCTKYVFTRQDAYSFIALGISVRIIYFFAVLKSLSLCWVPIPYQNYIFVCGVCVPCGGYPPVGTLYLYAVGRTASCSGYPPVRNIFVCGRTHMRTLQWVSPHQKYIYLYAGGRVCVRMRWVPVRKYHINICER